MNRQVIWDDTIVALATPPGVGAIALIRLSGSKAISIANELFPSKNLQKEPANTLHVGLLRLNNEVLDEVVLSLFKTPHSYTGEDVIEISCHGSIAVQEQVLNACRQAGARFARPGEFTQRAFLNGKMDLTQAEAVADLIASTTAASRRASLHQLKGGFKNDLNDIREKLIEFSALLELELDFAEEDVVFADRQKFNELLQSSLAKVNKLIESFTLGNAVTQGIKVAIVGKPNAGKSTLLNTLLNDERALVSEIAGTTRDTIEESINIKGIRFHFIDTAGIRNHSVDVIENMGIKKSREKIEQADIVILVTENVAEDAELMNLLQHKNVLVVVNKSDMTAPTLKLKNHIYISAKYKQGIDELTDALYQQVVKQEVDTADTLITNSRHVQHLQKISTYLQAVQQNMINGLSTDLIAPDLKLCLQEIGELTGTISNENVLDYIFSKFCIGK